VAPAVDLDDGEPLAILGPRGVVTRDVDLAEIVSSSGRGPQLFERPFAEVQPSAW
jgi:hypothetical protein